MRSRAIEMCVGGFAFLVGLFWIIVPSYWYYVDSIGYINAFLEERKLVILWHIYHPLFPGPWQWIWTREMVLQTPVDILRSGSVMISLTGALGIWATYKWGRLLGLRHSLSLLAAFTLCGFAAWIYFSTQWATFIPAIAFMLYAFLIVARGYANRDGLADGVYPGVLRLIIGGIVLGISTGFHGTTLMALPGFLIITGSKGRMKACIWFLAGYIAMVLGIWAIGLRQYNLLAGEGGLANWAGMAYAGEGKFWVQFDPLHILQSSMLGNLRTLFLGNLSSLWSPELTEHVASRGMPWWHGFVKSGGFIIALLGIGISIYAVIRGRSGNAINKQLAKLKWGLFAAWLPYAIYSSLFAAYTAHYRMFAWALFWWIFLIFFVRAYSGPRRKAALLGLVLFAIGLWSHNYVTGPLLWGDSTGNPFLVEAVTIGKSRVNTAPVVYESNYTGFERSMNVRLFCVGNFADVVKNVKGHQADYFIAAVERHQGFRISTEAMEELGWSVTPEGELLMDSEMPMIGDIVFDDLLAVSRITSPIGDIYFLGFE